MEISEEKAAELLAHPSNLWNKSQTKVVYKPLHNGGRTNGAKEIPPTIRALIGITAHHDTIASTMETFGVSQSTVSASKKGNVGVNRHDPDLKDAIDRGVEGETKSIREVALERLAGMFNGVINQQNLDAMKPVEAVRAAKDLATIVEKVTPKQKIGPTAVFISYVPPKEEREYPSVDVTAKIVRTEVG